MENAKELVRENKPIEDSLPPRKHMTGDKSSSKTSIIVACITTGGIILVAFITGFFGLLANRDAENPEPNVQITFETIEPIPQPVNGKLHEQDSVVSFLSNQEISTYRVVIKNNGNAPVTVTKGEYLVDSVTLPPTAGNITSQMALISLIGHDDHIEASMKSPEVGDTITFPLNFSIAADSRREFTVWFRGIDREAPVFFLTSGRIRIHTEGAYATSGPIKLEIHQESQYMPKTIDSPVRLE